MFTVDDKNNVKPMRETLLIPEFEAVWKADKTAHKAQAMKEFAYIYFVCNHKSPFVMKYAAKDVEKEVTKQILNKNKYVPPKRVQDAVEAYRRMYTPKIREVYDLADLAVSRLIAEIKNKLNTEKMTSSELKELYDFLLKVTPVATNLEKAAKAMEDDAMSSKNKKVMYTRWEIPSNDEPMSLSGIVE